MYYVVTFCATINIYGIAMKRDLRCLIEEKSGSYRLQLYSYAMKIKLSIMELQWPEIVCVYISTACGILDARVASWGYYCTCIE